MKARVKPVLGAKRPRFLTIYGAFLSCLLPACLDWGALQQGSCGDGFVGSEESCDDGNRKSGDGCDSRCEEEPRNLAQCGNGRTEAGETCDDRGTADGDGCSKSCQLEPVKMSCGNGKLDPEEVCDDGNDANDDACLNGCSRATCGDGQVRRNVEECDPAATDADACTPACLLCKGLPAAYFRTGNQHCFTVHAPAMAAEARATCQAEGGDLWTVTSKAEGSDVVTKLMLRGPYWLGLITRPASNSWVSGEGVKYLSFATGEPSTPDLGCVALVAGGDDELWQSSACDAQLSFVCERQAPAISLASNHAYKLETAAVSFAEARARCAAKGGSLAALETAEELAFVGGSVGLQAWVDAQDAEVEGRFVWPSAAEVDPAAFRAGQPDDGDGSQDCLFLGAGNRLYDESCGRTLPFVCELI